MFPWGHRCWLHCVLHKLTWARSHVGSWQMWVVQCVCCAGTGLSRAGALGSWLEPGRELALGCRVSQGWGDGAADMVHGLAVGTLGCSGGQRALCTQQAGGHVPSNPMGCPCAEHSRAACWCRGASGGALSRCSLIAAEATPSQPPLCWGIRLGQSAPVLALPSWQHRGGCGVGTSAVPWQSTKGKEQHGRSCWAGWVSQSAVRKPRSVPRP